MFYFFIQLADIFFRFYLFFLAKKVKKIIKAAASSTTVPAAAIIPICMLERFLVLLLKVEGAWAGGK